MTDTLDTTNVTKTSDLTGLIVNKMIIPFILPPNEPATVHQTISNYKGMSGQNSEVATFPREKSGGDTVLTYASPKVEASATGYGDPVKYEVVGADATGKIIGAKRQVTYPGKKISGISLAQVAKNTITMVRRRIGRDQCTIAAAATNASDYSGLYLTRQRFGKAKALYENQNPTGAYVFVGSPGQIESLRADIRDSSSALIVNDGEMRELFKFTRGFKGYLEGVPIFETSLVAAADASNDAGFFSTIGDQGALGLANWWDKDAPEENVIGGYKLDMEWDSDKDYWSIWAKAYLGHVVTNQANIRSVKSLKLAA